jgi:D-beta-D-heptose 7-phosphate kinase/D-beta-D-heptose 1-phosphate adenosyltransferase
LKHIAILSHPLTSPISCVQTLLDSLRSLRILVIGDAMLDHYIWGDAHRISPEAPVPVVHVSRDTWAAGGAANVAINLANLGVQTSLLGYLADDDAGRRLQEILLDHQVTLTRPLSTQSATPSIIKTRVMARGQQLCRIDREAPPANYRADHDREFLDLLARAVPDADAVIISDYAKGLIHQETVNRVLKESAKTSCLVAIDPKPASLLNFRGVGVLTPNRSEALELAGLKMFHPDDPYPLDLVCRRIHETHAPALLVITLGADGMAVSSNGVVIERIPTVAREVFDVSGAGDTVIATLTAALATGLCPSDAARFANLAAGCVVARMGTVPITRESILAAI